MSGSGLCFATCLMSESTHSERLSDTLDVRPELLLLLQLPVRVRLAAGPA